MHSPRTATRAVTHHLARLAAAAKRTDARDLQRSKSFRGRSHARYWWHQLPTTDFVPALYRDLSKDEWALMAAWYDETDRREMTGEINVPAMSLVQGIVHGGGVSRFVQLGHYCGYSALLIGFWLRRMGGPRRLVSVDHDPVATDFARAWIERAGLTAHVTLLVGNSTDPAMRDIVVSLVGGPPDLVLIDSSHAYTETKLELDLWVPSVVEQGLVLMHGTSVFAQGFDPTGEGGVGPAVDDWLADHADVAYLNMNRQVVPGDDAGELVYTDGCGLGLLQRMRPPTSQVGEAV